jgi:hypothetical protein
VVPRLGDPKPSWMDPLDRRDYRDLNDNRKLSILLGSVGTYFAYTQAMSKRLGLSEKVVIGAGAVATAGIVIGRAEGIWPSWQRYKKEVSTCAKFARLNDYGNDNGNFISAQKKLVRRNKQLAKLALRATPYLVGGGIMASRALPCQTKQEVRKYLAPTAIVAGVATGCLALLWSRNALQRIDGEIDALAQELAKTREPYEALQSWKVMKKHPIVEASDATSRVLREMILPKTLPSTEKYTSNVVNIKARLAEKRNNRYNFWLHSQSYLVDVGLMSYKSVSPAFCK